ncbi:ATP-binding cassette domain-containing protein [Mesorhizobium sp. RP14(2022)]|uniref:ATP-binding cassette domain-containing protein n=1 Tax=Mesorhizobium liriopis TaxID=2953882 RepID=A0ABT1C4D9_9HYPH|nr:ATP-binding cassette domain-containing protein [Mesorhizobium liriopis]MCO6049684.1 ATP-binding cassette domain-containing protein [Mesorhizobium liriopis]
MGQVLAMPTALPSQTNAAPFFSLLNIGKSYGSTRANDAITLDIHKSEVLGLVGANGAGKSTLMRILCGVTEPSDGEGRLDGQALDFSGFSPAEARRRGIRIVWQELSLAPNLSVAENFYVEQPQFAKLSPLWLSRYHRLAQESIERIFPRAGIATGRLVGELTIAERQMVEIARAASDPRLKLLILDEPTSSLGAERSAQLRSFARSLAERGASVIFISHKLAEVLSVSDRVVAMRNGRIAWVKETGETNIADLVEAMGGTGETVTRAAREAREKAPHPIRARITGARVEKLNRPLELHGGEIVGIAGLEGSGQRQLLEALFAGRNKDGVSREGAVRFVSGDRSREGAFPLWSVLDNIAIGRIARRAPLSLVSDTAERTEATARAEKLALDPKRLSSKIVELSGGNQQKALVARALDPEAEIVLLDDPTRGVDIAAKRDFYRVVREIAAQGRLVVWHSTEDLEFLECDRVLVFAKGRIVAELEGDAISEDRIVSASFTEPEIAVKEERRDVGRGLGLMLLRLVPFISLFAVFAVMASLNPLVASSFGLELLLAPAVTLVLVALAQMFVVGGSEIDLGVGAFTGFINVVSATLLVASPVLGTAALLCGLLGYGLIATLIQLRATPAIVVTLGASFIWMGWGQTVQPSPGGESPAWLSPLFTWAIPGLPTPLVLIVLAGFAAFVLDRSPWGTVLRGFGSSPMALVRSGWSAWRFAVLRYGIAALFGLVAGLYVTATNNASDINAGASFTLLSIAAVVIGGCQLLGGFIAPWGVVAGAVTLSLIGALLASLGVSTDFNAAVQGGLLIVILGLQALTLRRSRHG